MSELVISELRAGVQGREILKGLTLTVRSGEVHAIMGPNGSGKSTLSHVLMGKPGYEVLSGTVTLDGVDVLALPTWQRAKAGLFLAMQYPTEVPGVGLETMLRAALGGGALHEELAAEAERIGFDEKFLSRSLNVDLSGGEKKRNETLQLGVLRPKIAVLDDDALRDVSRRVEELTKEIDLGVLAITHYQRLLDELHADVVHVMVQGRIVTSGGKDLVADLERTGYAEYLEPEDDAPATAVVADPFADPLA
jgi:Fe-S cluster assembly ATP-binding protein